MVPVGAGQCSIMSDVETLEDLYKRKFDGAAYRWIPDTLRREFGHFNVFRLELFVGEKAQPVPYKRRDYYKIMLVVGHSKVHYADKVVAVQKQALSFSSPQIPYQWEHLEEVRRKDTSKRRIVEGIALDLAKLKKAIAGPDIVYINLAGDLETNRPDLTAAKISA